MAKERSMVLNNRGKTLEDEFFHRRDSKAIEAIRVDLAREATREKLREVSGMDDDAVLDKLVEIGISADTLSAVSLVPLVEVAWADGEVQDREREAILFGAQGKGIEEGSPAYELLSAWLERKPGPELLQAWDGYIAALDGQLTAEQLKILKRQVMDRARGVASAAGGFLGLKRVSAAEERVLARLDEAFERRAATIPAEGEVENEGADEDADEGEDK